VPLGISKALNFSTFATMLSFCVFLIFLGFSSNNANAEPRLFYVSTDSIGNSLDPSSHDSKALVQAKEQFSLGEWNLERLKYLEAFRHFMEAKVIIDRNNLQYTLLHSLLLRRLGNIYYYFGDYEKSAQYFKAWHYHLLKQEPLIFAHYNTFGLALYHLKEYELSNEMLRIGAYYANHSNRLDWLGLSLGNMAANYEALGQLDTAKRLFQQDYLIGKKEKNYITQVSCLLALSKIHIREGDWSFYEKAMPVLLKLHEKDGSYPLPLFYELRSKYYETKNKPDLAFEDYKKFTHLQDSVKTLKDKAKILELEFQLYASQTDEELQSLGGVAKKSKIKSIGLVFLVLGILSLAVYFNRYKRTKVKEILAYNEKQALIEHELQDTQTNLQETLKEVAQQSEQIEWLHERMEHEASKNQSLQNSLSKSNLNIDLSDVKLLTDANWNEFKSMFSAAYPNFIDSLIRLTGKLSYGELRMACMIRLNLTTYQMADMTGVSHDSAKKSLLRFKKKMNFETQADLIDFIFSLPT